MVRGLVPSMSDMSAKPFWYDCRIGSYMIRYKGYFHSCNGAAWWGTRNTWSGTEGLSEMIVRCSLTWLDVSAWPFWCDWGMCSHLIRYKGCFHSLNGGTWSVTRKAQYMTKGHSNMNVGCVLTWSDMSAWPFWCDWGMCSHLIIYKGYFHSLNGGTWSITRNPRSRTECLSDESRTDVSVVPFHRW